MYSRIHRATIQLLACFIYPEASVAQKVKCWPADLAVQGSRPAGTEIKFFWKVVARSIEISDASSFKILASNMSGPVALLRFSFCSNLSTPSAVTLMSGIAGKDVPSGFGMLLLSSLVHDDSYCLFRMSAYPWSPHGVFRFLTGVLYH